MNGKCDWGWKAGACDGIDGDARAWEGPQRPPFARAARPQPARPPPAPTV